MPPRISGNSVDAALAYAAPAIPAGGAKYQISTSGGTLPSWRRDGRELFYVSADQKLMAVPITLGATVEAGVPQELFATTWAGARKASQ